MSMIPTKDQEIASLRDENKRLRDALFGDSADTIEALRERVATLEGERKQLRDGIEEVIGYGTAFDAKGTHSKRVVTRLVALLNDQVHEHETCPACASCHDHERCPNCGVGHPREWECPPVHCDASDNQPFDESTCDRCGRTNHVWHTPPEVWAAVYGPGGQPTRQGVLCPSCFLDDTEAAGVTPPEGQPGWAVLLDVSDDQEGCLGCQGGSVTHTCREGATA